MNEIGKITIERALESDVDSMINLYRLVYGKKYPISYGNDPDLLKNAIKDQETHLVLVARDFKNKFVAGAMIVEIDKYFKIGKLLGLVVHPSYQKNKKFDDLIDLATKEIDPKKRIALYKQANKIITEDLPYISLWHPNVIWIGSRCLKNIELEPTGSFVSLPKVEKDCGNKK